MDLYQKWAEYRTKIPAGRYLLQCIKGERTIIFHKGKGGVGGSEKIVLWFEVFEGDHLGSLLPMFLSLQLDKRGRATGRVPQGSDYFLFWCIANGMERPLRPRLKEMPIAKFKDKVFDGQVVDVIPRWTTGEKEGEPLPGIFQYSRVIALYEVAIGGKS